MSKTEVFSRPPWERMMRMHHRIRNGEYPNCAAVAREFEVSVRTIKRDVEFMKCRLNLPIDYDNRRYGFYYTKPVEQFPGLPVTEAELFALLVAHKAIAQYHGTPFEKPLLTAFQKLGAQLDQSAKFTLGHLDAALSFRPLAPEDTDLSTFDVLSRAVQNERAIRFHYRKLGARRAERRHVHPHHLACIENVWYLFAYDVDRQAMRTFVLTRLSDPVLTGRGFTRQAGFRPDDYLRGSFSVFKGGDDYEVAIEFDAWATDLIRGRKWHSSQQFHELPGGGSRLSMRLNNIEEMERWVLSWGVHARVVSPRILGERLRRIALELAQRYANG